MKKLNNKGFMLAEIVIVSTVICTCMIILYTGLYKLKSSFYITDRYYDLDSLYVAIEVNNLLKRDKFNFKDNMSSYNSNRNYNNFINFYKNNTKNDIKVYIVKSKKEEVENIENSNKSFKDYINYLNDNIVYDNNKYLIIVERTNKLDINDIYYYTLELEYE